MLKKYGLFGVIRQIFFLINTKLFYRKAKIVRLPFDIRNKKNIKIKKGFTTGVHCRIEAYPEESFKNDKIIEFGKNVQLNDFVHIVGRKQVKIGDNVLIASKIFISDCNHGSYKGHLQSSPMEPPSERDLEYAPVEIKDNVWLGEYVCIMPGVTIGKGSIIGAMSVVTRDIPDFCIAVGSPAKVIKSYDFSIKKWISIKKK